MYIDTLNKFTDSKNQLVKELFFGILNQRKQI